MNSPENVFTRLWFAVSRRRRLALVFLMVLGTVSLAADEFDDLRRKWTDIITGGTNYNLADPQIAANVVSIAKTGSNYWVSLNKSPSRTYLWSELASTTDPSQLTSISGRLKSMAQAYFTYGSLWQGNTNLLADTVSALDWFNANRYRSGLAEYGNWWEWEIGIPMNLTDTTAMLYDRLSSTQISNYMAAVNYYTPVPNGTGANLVWTARVVGLRGCLVKDSAKIALTRDSFSDVFPYVTSGDGFYADGSFLFHNRHPYNGGYGLSLLSNLTPLLTWLDGSTWTVTDPQRTNVFQWVYDAFEPFIYKGAIMDMVRGREVRGGSDHQSGHSALQAILRLSESAPPADAARMRSMVKYWAAADTSRDLVDNAPLAQQTAAEALMQDNGTSPRGELLGHYTFGNMDRVVHLRPGFGFGISMSSKRIYNYESINGENLHGWYTGDGMTYLYNGDLTQFSDNFWPTINPYRMPGTTVDAGLVRTDASGQRYLSPNSWTGGATLEQYGAAGMQLDAYGCSLVAKKSWFMFADEIVCLGAGITSTDQRTIETVVENRQLSRNGGANLFTVDGELKPTALDWSETLTNVSWAHLAGRAGGDDMGYFFPQPGVIKALREARTGSWADINSGSSTNPITRNYLTMWFDHGKSPANATYAYVLLPNFPPWQTANYAARPGVTVLTNTAAMQAAQQETLGLTAVNFWNDGMSSIAGITTDRKACVLVKNDGNFLDIAVSDPTQTNTSSINLTVNAATTAILSADPGVTITQLAPTVQLSAGVTGAAGRTFRARLYLKPMTNAIFDAVADAYVYDGSPLANYGTAATMAVKQGPAGYNRTAFMRFDVSSLPPGGAFVGGVTLNLFASTASVPGVHALARVDDNTWSELGITWSNAPALGADVASWTPGSNAPVSVTLADSVASAINRGSNQLSFCIHATTQTSNGYVDYASRQNGTLTNRPQLVLTCLHEQPVVALTNPASSLVLSQPGSLTLGATASTADGSIAGVGFYDGPTLLGGVTSAPYTWTIPQVAAGQHQFYAVATNNWGLSAASSRVAVTVGGLPLVTDTNVITGAGQLVDVDLNDLAWSAQIPPQKLSFAVGAATNGIVTLLANGHTARFTPNPGYYGPAQFSYTATAPVEDARLLLHYPLQGNTADISGRGRNGLLNIYGTGDAFYTNDVPLAVASWLPQSLRFVENGTAGAAKLDRVMITTNELNFAKDNWAVTGWCKRANSSNWDMVFHLGTGSGGAWVDDLQLRFDSGANTLRLLNYNGASANDVNLSTTVNAGVWCHFAVIRSGGTLSLYVNGSLIGSDTSFSITADPAGPFSFGGNGTPGSYADRWFNGQFADLAIWTTPPTALEISRLALNRDVTHLNGNGLSAAGSVAVQVNVLASPTPLWSGKSPSNSFWSEPANWDGVAIQAGNSLFFDGNNRLNNTNDTAAGTVYQAITFNPNAGAFALDGNAVGVDQGITNRSAAAQRLGLPVIFAGDLTVDGGSGGVVLAAGLSNSTSAAASLVLSGRGSLSNLLGSATETAGTWTINSGANWFLGSSSSNVQSRVPWVLKCNGTLDFGSATDDPELILTTTNLSSVIGFLPGVATLNVSGGNLALPNDRLFTASSANATGMVNIARGQLNLRYGFQGATSSGANAASVVNVSGGLFNMGAYNGSTAQSLYVAQGGTGALNVSGGTVMVVNLDISGNTAGNTRGSVGVVNLDGGVIQADAVTTGSLSAQTTTTNGTAATFYFNGGTLKVRRNVGLAYQGRTTAPVIPIVSFVKAGGAVFDDSGYVMRINEPLQHDPALGNTADGGLIKRGGGSVVLSQNCTYTGPTVIHGGSLVLTNGGAIGSSGLIYLTNGAMFDVSGLSGQFVPGNGQTLAGRGRVGGSLTVANGALLVPGAANAGLALTNGTLTCSNDVTLNSGSTTLIAIQSALNPTNATLAVNGTLTYGGTLVITNIGMALTNPVNFKLFSAGAYGGQFANLQLPTLPGNFAWNWNPTSGTLSAISQVNTNPAQLTVSASNSILSLAWPADHLGWRLQVQSNASSVGLGANWVDVPNTETMIATNIFISPAQGAVFYRLIRP